MSTDTDFIRLNQTSYKIKNTENRLLILPCMVMMIIITLTVLFNSPLYADGFIVIHSQGDIYPPHHIHPMPPRPRPEFNPFPLEVKYHHVNVTVEDQIATTSIDQSFYNPTNSRLEGYYIFPIPTNAVIKKFSMTINNKEMQAELLNAEKARKIYEDIVRKQRDPALLEYNGRGIFKVRIFPIEPHSEKKIKISYTEALTKDNQTFEYTYPLNTEKFSSKPLNNVSIHMEIKSTEPIKTIYCPTHNTEIIRKNPNKAVVSFEEKNTKPDTDFKLYYSTQNTTLGFSLLSYKKGNDGYFFLSISPGYSTNQNQISPKDITFVLDVSGSMDGKKLQQAKKALLFCIHNLNKNDLFEIIRFSTEAEALFNGYSGVNEKNIQKAETFIENLKAIGGTNIDEALTLALQKEKNPTEGSPTSQLSKRPNFIVFLTDGKPTIGETDEARLLQKVKAANHHNIRIFTFGIGNDINTRLLDSITEITHAYRTYISEKEDIEVKLSNFYTNVQSPILTGLKIQYPENIHVSKVYPRELPDLFKGSSLTILGRYTGSGDADIVLTGNIDGKPQQFKFSAKEGFLASGSFESMKNEKNDFIASLWAARRVGYLLDQIRLHGNEKELVEEVTELARTYGIITPYTSYLIVEDEEAGRRPAGQLPPNARTLSGIIKKETHYARKNAEEYSAMKDSTGSGSIQASQELQELNTAVNITQAKTGVTRINYADDKGNIQNIQSQVKNIQGRAFYNNGKYWVDSYISLEKNQKVNSFNRIQFASPEYFKLIEKEPLSHQILSLGQNVRFVLRNTLYEIYE